MKSQEAYEWCDLDGIMDVIVNIGISQVPLQAL